MSAPIADLNRNVTPAWRSFFQSLWNRTGGGSDIVSLGSFIGEVKAYGGSTAPSSYMVCDGSPLSRATYANLFAVIGTLYGIGDGSTTFNLPDFRGRALLGAGAGPGLTTRTLGETGGTESVSLAVDQMPVHTHVVNDPQHHHAITDPGHVHSSVVASSNVTTGTSAGGVTSGNTGSAVTGISINDASTGITLADAGGTTAVSLMQPWAVVNYIIRVQ